MAIKKVNIDVKKKPTKKQTEMIKAAKNLPVTFDEDSPELTPDQLKRFRRISEEKNEDRRKGTVTLRLTPRALRKAKSLGKGYTSVLSRILEDALDDPQVIESHL
ncbi:BrnA antitoxin family protein [Butyrivibrio sp. INlla16]|uniref:BrnA antitoxin family protein n=1 Tax=Butyrivibrio sp. INlla16 TaxID=1520807 RepID=UPI0008879EBD|nr:BrnA antitoxin family protein [Butyrivibrio sp. INlla16]SDB12715.1 BrnA antitoxin of type II toxin-antitoxin system [Butyrivibrio sp. INlla16]SDB49733.1 BrnA antitoxin of type II toxin-antitoxin system [Butyrivibrio sp. INlla16]